MRRCIAVVGLFALPFGCAEPGGAEQDWLGTGSTVFPPPPDILPTLGSTPEMVYEPAPFEPEPNTEFVAAAGNPAGSGIGTPWCSMQKTLLRASDPFTPYGWCQLRNPEWGL